MGVESVTGIWDLDPANPLSTDDITTSDNHHRLIKKSLKWTFPNISGTIIVTPTEFGYLDGISANIQTQLDSLSQTVSVVAKSVSVAAARVVTLSASLATTNTNMEALSAQNAGAIHIKIDSGVTGAYWKSGWTLTKDATGQYTVTHTLPNNGYYVQVTPILGVPLEAYVSNAGSAVASFRVQEPDSTFIDAPLMVIFFEDI